jgi:hypothetical protein
MPPLCCHRLRHHHVLIPVVQVAVATAQSVFLLRQNRLLPVTVTAVEVKVATIGDEDDAIVTVTIHLHRPVSVHHRRRRFDETIREAVAFLVENVVKNRDHHPREDLLRLLIVGIIEEADTGILQDHHPPQQKIVGTDIAVEVTTLVDPQEGMIGMMRKMIQSPSTRSNHQI